MSPSSRRVLMIALIVLGVLFAVAAVIYAAEPAGKLPGFFPGFETASTHHHIKHALLCGALALASWIGAWMVSGPRRST